jgi:hypothetical protein
MAAGNSAKSKPSATCGAMFFECFNGVSGAAWIIAARRREERRQRNLIAADEQNEECAHDPHPLRAHVLVRAEFGARTLGDATANRQNIGSKRFRSGRVRLVAGTDGDVDGGLNPKRWQKLEPDELAQPSLEPIAIYRGVLVPGHDDADARSAKRGSENPDVEVHGPNSLPLLNDGLYVRTSRESVSTRKSKAVARRLRTCSGA